MVGRATCTTPTARVGGTVSRWRAPENGCTQGLCTGRIQGTAGSPHVKNLLCSRRCGYSNAARATCPCPCPCLCPCTCTADPAAALHHPPSVRASPSNDRHVAHVTDVAVAVAGIAATVAVTVVVVVLQVDSARPRGRQAPQDLPDALHAVLGDVVGRQVHLLLTTTDGGHGDDKHTRTHTYSTGEAGE